MKKIFLLTTVILSIAVQAQLKEGYVKYKMELIGAPASGLASSILPNTSMTIYFKSDRSLTETVTAMYIMRVLTDSKGTMMLMDGAGEKMYSRKTKEELEKEKPKNNAPQVVITKEKKKILGYDCTKAIMTMKNGKGKESNTIIWFTEKIQAFAVAGLINPDALANLKGMPLEVEVDQGTIRSRMTATEVSVKPVADAVFSLSTSGYVEKKVIAPVKH